MINPHLLEETRRERLNSVEPQKTQSPIEMLRMVIIFREAKIYKKSTYGPKK